MPHADTGGHRQTLRVLVRADGAIDQLVGNGICQILAQIVGNQLEHQIDRGCPARCRHPVAVHHKDRFRQGDVLEVFAETILIFPVDRGFLPVQQSGLGQRKGGRAQTADHHALAGLPAQPSQQLLGRRRLHVDAAAHYKRVVAAQIVQIAVQRKFCPCRTAHATAILADQTPVIGRTTRHAVGDAQTFHCRGKAEHGEVFQQHKDKAPCLFSVRKNAVGQTGVAHHVAFQVCVIRWGKVGAALKNLPKTLPTGGGEGQ